jgi:opacity protein-like surface antigen
METCNKETTMKRLLQFAVFGLAAAYAAGAAAQSSQRAGKWEFTLQPQYTHSMTFDSGNGSGGKIDSTLGFGFGVAYNLNNNLQLGGEFTWATANYSGTTAPAAGNPSGPTSFTGTLESNTIRFNATWNFIAQGDFTPFVTGGIGSTYIDTNIPVNPGAPSTPVCWYDPWWGYYCGAYTPTRTAYEVSYNAGAGVRWEVDRNIFLRALANRMWLDVGGSLGTTWVDQYRIDIGFKF